MPITVHYTVHFNDNDETSGTATVVNWHTLDGFFRKFENDNGFEWATDGISHMYFMTAGGHNPRKIQHPNNNNNNFELRTALARNGFNKIDDDSHYTYQADIYEKNPPRRRNNSSRSRRGNSSKSSRSNRGGGKKNTTRYRKQKH
jgi:hypothetical protein